MGTWRVNNSTSLGGEVCSEWQASHAYSLGARCVCTWGYATVAAKARVFECTTAGTSGGTEPTWDTTVTNTTNDGTAVWTCRSPDDGSWDNASCYLDYVLNHASVAGGDRVYVDESHAENVNEIDSYVVPGTATPGSWIEVLCVDKDNSDALSTGAVVQTSGASMSIYLAGYLYSYGILYKTSNNIIVSSAATDSAIVLESDGSDVLELSNSAKQFQVGYFSAAKAPTVVVRNAGIKFDYATNAIAIGLYGRFEWTGGGLTAANGTQNLFTNNIYAQSVVTVKDVDLSDVGDGANARSLVYVGTNTQFHALFERCKLPSDSGFNIVNGSWLSAQKGKVRCHHCSDANSTLDLVEESYEGKTEDETTITRSGGAQHGPTNYSLKLASSANTIDRVNALESPPIHCWTDTTGSVTFTLHGVLDSATNLQDDEIWIELDYPANNTDGLGNRKTTRVDPLGTPSDCPASTETWNGTGGFGNENKFKLTATFTTGKAGPITARVYLAKPSTTVYIDQTLIES